MQYSYIYPLKYNIKSWVATPIHPIHYKITSFNHDPQHTKVHKNPQTHKPLSWFVPWSLGSHRWWDAPNAFGILLGRFTGLNLDLHIVLKAGKKCPVKLDNSDFITGYVLKGCLFGFYSGSWSRPLPSCVPVGGLSSSICLKRPFTGRSGGLKARWRYIMIQHDTTLQWQSEMYC